VLTDEPECIEHFADLAVPELKRPSRADRHARGDAACARVPSGNLNPVLADQRDAPLNTDVTTLGVARAPAALASSSEPAKLLQALVVQPHRAARSLNQNGALIPNAGPLVLLDPPNMLRCATKFVGLHHSPMLRFPVNGLYVLEMDADAEASNDR
jgi:hypothetical protein